MGMGEAPVHLQALPLQRMLPTSPSVQGLPFTMFAAMRVKLYCTTPPHGPTVASVAGS